MFNKRQEPLTLRMDLGEHLKCAVCKEIKPNPQESKCCHKLFCPDCVQSMTNTRVCTICEQETGLCENTFASQLINIRLSSDVSIEDYFANVFRNNVPHMFRTIIDNYVSQIAPNPGFNPPDTDLSNAFNITVLNLEDRRINIVVERSDTIKILKLKFQQKDGTSPEHQRLIFQGKQLEDQLTVSHYKLERNSVIHFVKRYNGS